MPYKVFVAGEEALAADVNSYLMAQTVARFTNATQRTSLLSAPVLNQLSELDTNPGVLYYWSGTAWAVAAGGGAWTEYVPALAGDSGASSIGNGTVIARYKVLGEKVIVGQFRFIRGSTSSLNPGVIRIGMPAGLSLNFASSTGGGPLGIATVYRPGSGQVFAGAVLPASATQWTMYLPTASNNCVLTQALDTNSAVGDTFSGEIMGELA